ncbi:saccharopine dehydrogenase C-terminal domain-containing protein [Labilibacter marinus]|uniref:saccharopine dehydrogenase C-terminal domain-containing protein n=1 Tax=Labilibacter marinus TaxID=1477105 RepID=UPI00082F5ED3|nr:saccharopine dehydrogenase C-terminal domain-containing protein [Labilibacter marinus]
MKDSPQILILGAGKVAAPMVRYFLSRKYHVTVASEYAYQAELIIENNPLGESVEWHSNDLNRLNSLIMSSDIVVSLLPYHLHVIVCKACIKCRKNLITTSYQQPEMDALHSEACKSNITILNEMGLDPGIDHMWASKMIDSVRAQGGKVEKFISVCGALPSPESLDNPFRYKFSWSPFGVMKASMSNAHYLKDGKLCEHGRGDLMKNTFDLNIDGIGDLQAYANRDSIKYIELYDVPEVKTFFRGTLRYKGWCEILDTLIKTGYLSEEPFPENITTYAQLTSYLNKLNGAENLRDAFAEKLKVETHSNSIMAMEWIGLFSNNHFSTFYENPLTVLTNKMIGKMKMLPSDKDLVLLNHHLMYALPDGTKKVLTGALNMLGADNENTAIARTVSYPAALAVELFLEKRIAHKGVIRPFYKEIYEPILNALTDRFNFSFIEREDDVSIWPENW